MVCFESSQGVTKLPCDCKVAYCAQCWDRCLAQSFNACGQARCPTCRGPVRVDFDAATSRMLFSRDLESVDVCEEAAEEEEEEEPADEEEEEDAGHPGPSEAEGEDAAAQPPPPPSGRPDRGAGTGTPATPTARGRRGRSAGAAAREDRSSRARNRLIEQARPAQVRLLREYMREPPAGMAPPRCVCGGALERLTGEERVRRVFGRQLPVNMHGTAIFEQIVAGILNQGRSICSCDLCGRSIDPRSAVWTCQNGNRTILHANAYDVCESCFRLHTGCGSPAAGAGRGTEGPPRNEPGALDQATTA